MGDDCKEKRFGSLMSALSSLVAPRSPVSRHPPPRGPVPAPAFKSLGWRGRIPKLHHLTQAQLIRKCYCRKNDAHANAIHHVMSAMHSACLR